MSKHGRGSQRCANLTSCTCVLSLSKLTKCDVVKPVRPDTDPPLPGRQLPEPANTCGSVEHLGRSGRLHEPRASRVGEARSSSSANDSRGASCPTSCPAAADLPPTPSICNLVRKVALQFYLFQPVATGSVLYFKPVATIPVLSFKQFQF